MQPYERDDVQRAGAILDRGFAGVRRIERVSVPGGMKGIDRAYLVRSDSMAPLVRLGDVLCCVEAPPGAGGFLVAEFSCGYAKLTHDGPTAGAMSVARVKFIIKR